MANCENTKQYDNVHKPSHYTEGRQYEPKDVIRDWGLNFNLGSAVKYLSRAGRKDDIVQDLSKAKEFIQFEIDAILAEKAENDDKMDAIAYAFGMKAPEKGAPVKHCNCKCSVHPVFAEKEDGTGVSFGVMELDVPAGMPPEEIIQMVINKLYGGE